MKRILSMALAVFMVFTSVDVTAFAQENNAGVTVLTESETAIAESAGEETALEESKEAEAAPEETGEVAEETTQTETAPEESKEADTSAEEGKEADTSTEEMTETEIVTEEITEEEAVTETTPSGKNASETVPEKKDAKVENQKVAAEAGISFTLEPDGSGEYILTISGEGTIEEHPNGWVYGDITGSYDNISEIIIEEGITEIGEGVFEAYRMDNVEFPASLSVIGNNAFANCTYLKMLSLPEGLQEIGNNAFRNCQRLIGSEKGLVIPVTVEVIGDSAFQECKALESLTFSTYGGEQADEYISKLDEIGDSAFYYCWSLEGDLRIPNSVTKIGSHAFHIIYDKDFGRQGFDTVVLSDRITTIPASCFADAGIKGLLEIPDSVTGIGKGAFASAQISQVTFPSGFCRSYWCSGIFKLQQYC